MPPPHDLTPSQQLAVEHVDGPLLVLAGPGSGKTRVITRRIAHLIEQGVDPRQILAITFTNKAATEMGTRLADILPGCRVGVRPPLGVWVSTFHRFCARQLRQRAEAVGLAANFTIFDTADQRQLIKQTLRELDIDAVHYPPARIASRISRAKNDLQTADAFARRFQESIGDHMQAVVARVYPKYQQALLNSNAVDFDDLLLHVVTLLSENPELRRELDARFRYVLVDEYQDTNSAQYRIVAALSQDHPNLCVTGDPDQSIYGWRGARIDNILRFEADYPTARVVRLEQNFRSTGRILRAAEGLITHNTYRKAKSLVTDNAEGTPVELLCFRDGKHEADFVAREIRRLVSSGERRWADFALFYRVNALSREMERALTRHRVPYQIAAGVEFYERAEIKDMLAYLRLIYNPHDSGAFQRIVNRPLRGIGKTTQTRLAKWAASEGVNLLEAAGRADQVPKLSKRAVGALKHFAEMLDDFSRDQIGSIETLIETVINRTAYTAAWRESESEQDHERLANVDELRTAARQYDREFNDESTLEGFLEMSSLAGDVDSLDETAGAVTLMTLHAAKGLEFPVVYILAVEHGLIPHERSVRHDDLRELEEERRLLFVGMTRAEEQLFLTQTVSREFRGRRLTTVPSEFLQETELALNDQTGESSVARPEPSDGRGRHSGGTPPRPSKTQSVPPRPEDRPLLTTAADLLNGTRNSAEISQGFAVGMTVRHPHYGLGTVVTIGGFAKRRTVTVEFEQDDRSETFIAAKCPLQPVGIR